MKGRVGEHVLLLAYVECLQLVAQGDWDRLTAVL
jgi:hypothetical protein